MEAKKRIQNYPIARCENLKNHEVRISGYQADQLKTECITFLTQAYSGTVTHYCPTLPFIVVVVVVVVAEVVAAGIVAAVLMVIVAQ